MPIGDEQDEDQTPVKIPSDLLQKIKEVAQKFFDK